MTERTRAIDAPLRTGEEILAQARASAAQSPKPRGNARADGVDGVGGTRA
jgi:hypothetical protein